MPETADGCTTTPPPGFGALVTRYTVDRTDMRIFAAVRAALAVFAMGASGLLLMSRVPVVIFGVALVGVLVPLVWLRQAKTARLRAASPEAHCIELFEGGLIVREGPCATPLNYHEISSFSVDEERLDIIVKRTQGPDFRIEPRYAGVAIHELMDRLSSARALALDSAAPSSTPPP
ncbi:MAG: hypothetical protein RL385_6028 [Pseudomonadota bacterium]